MSKKSFISYTDQEKRAIHLVSINKKDFLEPVGSYISNFHGNPGDIDLREEIVKCCSISEATHKIASDIKGMVRHLDNLKNGFFSDFKAGLNPMINVNIGYIDYASNSIKMYNYDKIRSELLDLEDNNIAGDLLKYAVKTPTIPQWYLLRKHINSKRELKWDEAEILKGYKILPNDRRIYLIDALMDNSIVKLDILYWMGGILTEVSNFLILYYNNGNELISLNGEQPEYSQAVRRDIYKFFAIGKPYKALKRMWNISNFENDPETMNKINPLLSSGISILSKIRADLESLILLDNKNFRRNIKLIRIELDQFKAKLSRVSEVEVSDDIYAKIDKIRNSVKNSPTAAELEKAKEDMNLLSYDLLKLINSVVWPFAKNNNLYPIPNFYIPNETMGGFVKSLALTAYQKLANAFRKGDPKSRQLYKGEMHPLKANFEGPGTRVDLQEVRDFPPYNSVDACAKVHDLAYRDISKMKDLKEREKSIREADKIFLDCLEKSGKEEPYYTLGKKGIETKNKLEGLLPSLVKLVAPTYFGSGYCCENYHL